MPSFLAISRLLTPCSKVRFDLGGVSGDRLRPTVRVAFLAGQGDLGRHAIALELGMSAFFNPGVRFRRMNRNPPTSSDGHRRIVDRRRKRGIRAGEACINRGCRG
jgi:hypothetical protein